MPQPFSGMLSESNLLLWDFLVVSFLILFSCLITFNP